MTSAAFLTHHLFGSSIIQTHRLGCKPWEDCWFMETYKMGSVTLMEGCTEHASLPGTLSWLHKEQSKGLSRYTARHQIPHIVFLSLQQSRNRKGREHENNAQSSSTSQRKLQSYNHQLSKLHKNLTQGECSFILVFFFPPTDSCNFYITLLIRQQQPKEPDS